MFTRSFRVMGTMERLLGGRVTHYHSKKLLKHPKQVTLLLLLLLEPLRICAGVGWSLELAPGMYCARLVVPEPAARIMDIGIRTTSSRLIWPPATWLWIRRCVLAGVLRVLVVAVVLLPLPLVSL